MKTITRRDFALGLSASIAALASIPAFAQDQTPKEGTQYRRLGKREPIEVPGKVEVLEFFSYACPHCADLESMLQPWMKKLPADVVFHKVPVPFLMSADTLMKSYYAFDALGMTEHMSPVVFAAMNVQRQRLSTLDEMAALVAKNGGDSAKFLSMAQSFAVAGRVGRAKKMQDEYGIDSTPTFVVQGLYVTSPAQAGGYPQALNVVDYLIGAARHAT